MAAIAAVIRRGLPVVIPTETQYALAADATSPAAIARVRAMKGRDSAIPFSIFLPGIDSLAQWKITCPEHARRLAERFWPGPLTLVLSTSGRVFKLLGGDGRSVGVRVTPEPIVNLLLRRLNRPLLATSANPSGVRLDPKAENRWLAARAGDDALVWARPRRYLRRSASTVLDCTGRSPRSLREGSIARAEWSLVV